MEKKKKTTDPYEVEMLDLLNEVGGQMVIKYHTITPEKSAGIYPGGRSGRGSTQRYLRGCRGRGPEHQQSRREPDGRCLGAGYREPIRRIDYGTDRISYYQQRSSLQW